MQLMVFLWRECYENSGFKEKELLVNLDLFGLFAEEIGEAVRPYGLEKYRGGQIASWMYQRFTREFSDMTDLPKAKRDLLTAHFSLGLAKVEAEQHSRDKLTTKFLLSFADGQAVETVVMRHRHGNSICVSSQVGCAMGCVFCASTLNGVKRNLSSGEMLAQVIIINQLLSQVGSHVDSVVIMGSGEPLANYDNVLRFIRLCHESYCLNMSYRSFTLSTVGLVPEIDRLAGEGLPVTLAISLHAPDNTIRSQLIPVNRQYPVEDLVAAADRYAAKTGRRVTYEYILIAGVNDRDDDARKLAALLRGKLANVNLIPVNAIPERGLLRPEQTSIKRFLDILVSGKVNATIRREMGTDIKAACGQLRSAVLTQRLHEKVPREDG